MSITTHQVVGTGYDAQQHDNVSEAVMAIAERIADHLAQGDGHWVNCEFSHDGDISSVITISKCD